jgi:hypothetical protein
MRTRFAIALAAIAIVVGSGDASATDMKQLSSGASWQAIDALEQSLNQGASFSALTSSTAAVKEADSLKGLSPLVSQEALVRPEEYAQQSGLVVFARVTRNDIASHEGIIGAPQMGRNGFAALKTTGEHGVTALPGLSARQEQSQELLQRPAGTQWSEGFQGLR